MGLLDFFNNLYAPPAQQSVNVWDSEAARTMRQHNRNALIAQEKGYFVGIEEWWDCDTDRRTYKLEYRSTLDGRRAVAFCIHNPWGVTDISGHIFSDGLLCLGPNHTRDPRRSSMDLDTVIKRARYWTTGFSMFQETGEFPDP